MISGLLIFLGAFASLGVLGFPSVLGALFARKKNPTSLSSETAIPKVQILIPAHNEKDKIGYTLESLERELKTSGADIKIHVALDRCTDGTDVASAAWQARLPLTISSVDYGSKWRTLAHLLSQSDSSTQWVIFVDAGTIWDAGTLSALMILMKNQDLSVIAPSYRIEGGSRLSQIFWKYESRLKTLENWLGGPISVHGASVAFRRSELVWAFEELKGTEFKNDDIILPLAVRILSPEQRSLYLPLSTIHDRASLESHGFSQQLRRRKRMVLGNLQWIRWMLRESRKRPIALNVWCVSLRRILRPFWIWSIVLLGSGLIAGGCSLGWFALVPMAAFPSAACASFYAPVAWILRLDEKSSAWR